MNTEIKLQIRNALLVLAGAVAFLAICLFVGITLRGPSPESVQNSQLALRNTLVWSCEHVGNPNRAVIRAIIEEEIRGSKNVKSSYFPGIPRKVLHRLIKAQTRAKRRRLKRVQPINCPAFYPKP